VASNGKSGRDRIKADYSAVEPFQMLIAEIERLQAGQEAALAS